MYIIIYIEYMYIYLCIYLWYICTRICCIYINMYMFVYICLYLYSYVCMYICICEYMYIYVHICILLNLKSLYLLRPCDKSFLVRVSLCIVSLYVIFMQRRTVCVGWYMISMNHWVNNFQCLPFNKVLAS